MQKKCIFILGGARSGKSSYAQHIAGSISDKVLFVATAEPLNDDMKVRIETHQRERPEAWRTLETATHLAHSILEHIHDADVILIDCLTLLSSNIILGESRGFSRLNGVDEEAAAKRVNAEIEALIALMSRTDVTFIVVSNEVGLGLVPDNDLGRIYRDLLGRANQLVAQYADEVYFLVAGIPIKVKG